MTLDAKLTDTHILALTLYGETRSASLEEMIALGALIRNRHLIDDETYHDICLSYPCWTDDSGNHTKLLAILDSLLNGTVTDPQYLEAAWVAIGIIRNWCRDVVKGATRSHPATMTPRPDWAQTKIPILTYAKQTFYEAAP